MYSSDYFVTNHDGSAVYYLLQRNGYKTISLAGIGFDEANLANPWSNLGWIAWNLDRIAGSTGKLRQSMVLSTDETHLITFTSNFAEGGNDNMDCRYDVF